MRIPKVKSVVTFSICILIIGLSVVFLMVFNHTINPSNIIIKSVDASVNKITLKGEIIGSADLYKNYEVSYHNESLYIKIKGGLISFTKSSGSIDISIANTYGKINKIYLQNDGTSGNILIWPKK